MEMEGAGLSASHGYALFSPNSSRLYCRSQRFSVPGTSFSMDHGVSPVIDIT